MSNKNLIEKEENFNIIPVIIFLLIMGLGAFFFFGKIFVAIQTTKNIKETCKINFEQKVPLSGKEDKCFKYYNIFLKKEREKERIKKELLKENLLKESLTEEELKLLQKLKDKGFVK